MQNEIGASMMQTQFPERMLQQGSDEWKTARLGHVSASCVADVMAKGKSGEAATRAKYKSKLIAERMTGQSQDSYSNAAMEWGVEQESFARMAYEVSRETFVDKTGFWKHPTIAWLGVSPDGLVGADGLVEIKCPNSSTHVDYLRANKVPADYYKQIQCQLWVTGRNWCDFISFDPRMKNERNKLFIVRTERDEELIAEMEQEVLKFLAEIEDITNNLNGATT
jgi:putative phage-type endonuclease